MTVDLLRLVEVHEMMRGLRAYGLTQANIAIAVGVSDRTVRSWQHSGAARPKSEQRLHDLRDIVLIVENSLTKRGVGQWFRARNRLLAGRKPLDALAAGEYTKVRAAAEAFAEGAYV